MRPTSHAPESTPARPTLPWASVGLPFAAMFVVMGARTSFAVLYPAMVVDLGWSVAEVTAAYSAGLLVYAPMAVAIGFLVDRVGCRLTMLGGGLFLIVGMALVAVSAELWHVYVAFMLATGLGSSGVGFITVVKLLALQAPRRFPAAFGFAMMGQGFGALIVSPTIQAVVDLAGWRAGALAFAGLVVGLLPLVALVAPGQQPATERRHVAGAHGATGLRRWVFVAFFVGNAGLGYQMLLPTHQVAHLIEAGFSSMSSALTAGVWGALTAFGGLIGGWALERWGGGRLLALATVLFGVGTAALVISTPGAAWLILLFIVAGGFGRGMLGLSLAAGQTRAFAGPRLGIMTGLLDLGHGIGGFLGPWLTAVVHDANGGFGPGIASSIAAAVATAAATMVGSHLAVSRQPSAISRQPGKQQTTPVKG